MSVTPASFRQDFPEFNANPPYTDSLIQYYLVLAGLLLNKNRWGLPSTAANSPPNNMYDMATELFVAHHIAIEAAAQKAAAAGGMPGSPQGPTTSKHVGPISVSYDAGSVLETGAGFWNTTMYGTRFYRLMMMFGAGPVQVNIGRDPTPWNGPAWPGPLIWPGWQG